MLRECFYNPPNLFTTLIHFHVCVCVCVCVRVGLRQKKVEKVSGWRELRPKVFEFILCLLFVCVVHACICICVHHPTGVNVIILAQRQHGFKFHHVWRAHEFIPS